MGSRGVSIQMKRAGKKAGDAQGLFDAMQEQLLDSIWGNAAKVAGIKAYIESPNVEIFMTDRWQRNDRELYFAFWHEQVEEPISDFAIHIAIRSLADDPATFTTIAEGFGFTLDLAPFASDDGSFGSFAMHSSTRVCRVLPWRRGEPVTAKPRFACSLEKTPHKAPPPSKVALHRVRNCAMTGLCGCKVCDVPETDAIARAWKALDAEPKKALALAKDEAGREVLKDWLEDRDVVLDTPIVAALATRYVEADPFVAARKTR